MTCKVIRIGVFFDGTGNNLFNDKAKGKESNIAKLYALYTKLSENGKSPCLFGNRKDECKIFTSAIYIEGVGTQAGKEDEKSGLATGSGGAERIRLAIKQLKQLKNTFPDKEYKCYLDIFGFSRGAALARDFINTIQNKKRKELNVIIKFVGLFDTVGSFGKAGDDKNYKPITKNNGELASSEGWSFLWEFFHLSPPASEYAPYNFNLSNLSAENIVHLVALDEYRKNFPLTDTNGAGQTYTLIGAHSDVGGGYEPMVKENIYEHFQHRDKAAALHQVENPENGIPIGENWQAGWRHYREIDLSYEGEKEILKCSGIRQVSNDLQQVGLITMYNLAVRAGVPLLPFTLDLSESNLKKLTQEIAYSEYHLAFKPVDKHSQSLSSLLGESSHWSQELKAYCIEAIESPSSLSSYLGQTTYYVHGKNRDSALNIRAPHHLRILAKYAHTSYCAVEKRAPAVGFKHREPPDVSESLANDINYPSSTKENITPMRELFSNNPDEAASR